MPIGAARSGRFGTARSGDAARGGDRVRVGAIVWLCLTANTRAASFAVFFGDEQFYLERAFRLYNIRWAFPSRRNRSSTPTTRWASRPIRIPGAAADARRADAVPHPPLEHVAVPRCVVCLFRLVRASSGPATAMVGLVYLLFLPSLFMWSVSALKESLFLLLSSVTLDPVGAAARAPRKAAVAAIVAAVALGWWLEALRTGSRAIYLAAPRWCTLREWCAAARDDGRRLRRRAGTPRSYGSAAAAAAAGPAAGLRALSPRPRRHARPRLQTAGPEILHMVDAARRAADDVEESHATSSARSCTSSSNRFRGA